MQWLFHEPARKWRAVLRASSAPAFEIDKCQRIISNTFVNLLINQHRYLIELNKYSQLPMA
jgi:hypothetical protein